MKILSLVSSSLLALSIFSSCSKEKSIDTLGGADSLNPGGPAVQTALVRTYTEDITSPVLGNSKNTYTLSYDQNNRITALTQTTAGLKVIYQYPNTSTVILNYSDSGALVTQAILWLNSRGLVDSSFQTIDSDTSTEKYIYNSSNELTDEITYDYSVLTGGEVYDVDHYTYDNNGNPISDLNGSGLTTYTYTSKINPNPLAEVFFFQSPNLIATATATDGTNTDTGTYTYTYDSSNRLSTATEKTSDGTVVVKTYTY